MLVVKTTSPATSTSPAKLQPSKRAPSSRTSVALLLGPCCKLSSDPVVHQLSANYCSRDPPRQRAPEVRGVGGPAQQGLPIHRPLFREIQEREIRRRAYSQATAPVDPVSWGAAHRLDQPGERDSIVQNQLRVESREGRLVTEESGRGLLQRQLLLLGGVRRVVGGHEVEGAVSQGFRNAGAVPLRPQRRVYPVHPVERGDQGVGQRQVVRGGVCSDPRAALEEPDERSRKSRRDVGYVDLRPGLRGEHQGRRRRRVLRAGGRAGDTG